jgi:hypothetical protein
MNALPAAVRLLLPQDSLVVPPGQTVDRATVQTLAPGQRVALADGRFGSRRRLRRRAASLGLEVYGEYAVLPTWGRGAFAVEDSPKTLTWAFSTIFTVPPDVARGALAVDLLLRGSRRSGLLGLSGRVAPGRLLIGARP